MKKMLRRIEPAWKNWWFTLRILDRNYEYIWWCRRQRLISFALIIFVRDRRVIVMYLPTKIYAFVRSLSLDALIVRVASALPDTRAYSGHANRIIKKRPNIWQGKCVTNYAETTTACFTGSYIYFEYQLREYIPCQNKNASPITQRPIA